MKIGKSIAGAGWFVGKGASGANGNQGHLAGDAQQAVERGAQQRGGPGAGGDDDPGGGDCAVFCRDLHLGAGLGDGSGLRAGADGSTQGTRLIQLGGDAFLGADIAGAGFVIGDIGVGHADQMREAAADFGGR